MRTNLILLYLVAIITFSCDNKEDSIREKVNINREWKYIQGDFKGAEAVDYDDTKWDYVNIPHCFSIPYFQTGFWYSGYGWYRKYFVIPEKWDGKQVFVEFEGAFRDAEIFVNGKLAGTHQSGYTGFSLDITKLITTGKNVLAVRLNNLWNSQLAPRGGDHIFPGGIYRDVYLVATNSTHITWYGTFVTTPEVSKEKAVVNIKTEVKNEIDEVKQLELRTVIYDSENKEVDSFSSSLKIPGGETIVFDQTGKEISSPKLWHPDTPNLYKVISELYIGKQLIDVYKTTFGIRWMEWSPTNGFFLNGEHYYFKGANVHQDHAGWASAVTNAALIRDVQLIKDAGMDFIRGSHYPHDPAFSFACDSFGILLLQENNFWSCGIRGDGGWYTGDGAYPPKEEDRKPFEESVKASLEEMIRIHRNHPSILAWSMCNEPFFSKEELYPRVREFLSELTDVSHILDPSRKVVVGGVQRAEMDRTADIAGYNGDGARLYINPGVPNFVSEYRSTIEDRPGTYAPGWGDLQQEQFSWRCGQSIWCAFDYGTHIGGGKFGHMGMIDYYRLPKRMWYWYRNEYKQIPPPEWPEYGVPAKLELTASKTELKETDGTDDIHLIVSVLNKDGKQISNCPNVTLSVESGPGIFPTGKQITFSADSDIAIRDGKAAIEFRSYYGGTTKIRAYSPGLSDAFIEIKTKGSPKFVEGKSIEPADILYKAYKIPKLESNSEDGLELSYLKPTRASGEQLDHSACLGNDKDLKTFWLADNENGESWWQVDLEAIKTITKVNVYFPKVSNYRYFVSLSENGKDWKILFNEERNQLAYKFKSLQSQNGESGRFLRIYFIPSGSGSILGFSDIQVFGD